MKQRPLENIREQGRQMNGARYKVRYKVQSGRINLQYQKNFLVKYNFAEETIFLLVWLLVMRQNLYYFQYAMHLD